MNNGEGSYRRFLSGDKEALIEIIRDYKDGLIIYINSIVNNIQIAEDITEDTFVKLYTDRPSFRGASSFKTWLYSIGRFTAIDYLRKNSGKTIVSYDEMFMIPDEVNIEQKVVNDEEKFKLFSSIKRLKPEYGQVIYLMYFENFSRAETAKIMKKTQKQISDLLYRAKNALKSEFEKGEKV